jgi:NADH-quinone oxidoreductase subunit J
MPTRPHLNLGSHLLPGLVALALFAVLAAVFLTSSFGEAAGFPTDVSITANIGYALIDLQRLGTIPTDGFLAALLIIAVVLDAALDGAVMLAKREGDEKLIGIESTRTDGGRPRDSAAGGTDSDSVSDTASDTRTGTNTEEAN